MVFWENVYILEPIADHESPRLKQGRSAMGWVASFKNVKRPGQNIFLKKVRLSFGEMCTF